MESYKNLKPYSCYQLHHKLPTVIITLVAQCFFVTYCYLLLMQTVSVFCHHQFPVTMDLSAFDWLIMSTNIVWFVRSTLHMCHIVDGNKIWNMIDAYTFGTCRISSLWSIRVCCNNQKIHMTLLLLRFEYKIFFILLPFTIQSNIWDILALPWHISSWIMMSDDK